MDILINGVTLHGDFMDADFMEVYESATIEMRNLAVENQGKKYESMAESYRAQCRIVDEYMDKIFGNGTSADLFKGKENHLMVHLTAVEDLTKWAEGEKKKLNDFINKYSQRQNAIAKHQKQQNAQQQFIQRKNGSKH